MRILAFLIILVTIASAVSRAENLQFVPKTTLQQQLANNTSAANSFRNSRNGNMGATHISKVNEHSLLYPGATTKVYAHLMPWWGDPRHIEVGYNSQDRKQIHRQISDMISRGIDGVIIDWYGFRDRFSNQTTLRVMEEVEQHPGFTFAIMMDKGAIKLSACPHCTAQQTLIEQLRYVEDTFVPSRSYLRIDGQPVITNFDVEQHFPDIDWRAAMASLSQPSALIFEDANGFSHTSSHGSYSWVRPSTTDLGMEYMTKFYRAGLSHPNLLTIGAGYKGFNDSMASWGLNRVMKQDCGQTWLKTFAKLRNYYNSARQLDAMQLVTWNDYEEGTEIESGIDNCLAVNARLSGNTIQWSISGQQNTIDHFVVYISRDGNNLMPLDLLKAGTRTLNLCSFSPATPTKYVVYVQAVGRPMLRSHMSHAIPYEPACGS